MLAFATLSPVATGLALDCSSYQVEQSTMAAADKSLVSTAAVAFSGALVGAAVVFALYTRRAKEDLVALEKRLEASAADAVRRSASTVSKAEKVFPPVKTPARQVRFLADPYYIQLRAMSHPANIFAEAHPDFWRSWIRRQQLGGCADDSGEATPLQFHAYSDAINCFLMVAGPYCLRHGQFVHRQAQEH
jgi:hypothetical protein